MINSDERREVAARLRNLAGHIAADEEMTLDALGLYRGENIEGYDTYGVMHLADLIDPTCSMTCKGSFTAHHDFTRWECGECGAYAFAPKKVFAPRFCPNCGARVVDE